MDILDQFQSVLKHKKWSRVGLQFHSTDVLALKPVLEELLSLSPEFEIVVLGDGGSNSCCLNVIQARSMNLDGIVVFGGCCKSSSPSVPHVVLPVPQTQPPETAAVSLAKAVHDVGRLEEQDPARVLLLLLEEPCRPLQLEATAAVSCSPEAQGIGQGAEEAVAEWIPGLSTDVSVAKAENYEALQSICDKYLHSQETENMDTEGQQTRSASGEDSVVVVASSGSAAAHRLYFADQTQTIYHLTPGTTAALYRVPERAAARGFAARYAAMDRLHSEFQEEEEEVEEEVEEEEVEEEEVEEEEVEERRGAVAFVCSPLYCHGGVLTALQAWECRARKQGFSVLRIFLANVSPEVLANFSASVSMFVLVDCPQRSLFLNPASPLQKRREFLVPLLLPCELAYVLGWSADRAHEVDFERVHTRVFA